MGSFLSALGSMAESEGKNFLKSMDPRKQNQEGSASPDQSVNYDVSHPQDALQWAFDKGGVLPKINLHDGNHKLVVAEAGERILTPEQNHDYEAQHPDARKEPMVAEVYDGSGVVGGSEISEATPLGKSIANRTQELYAQAKDGGQSIMDPKDPGSAGRRRETNAVLNVVSSRNEGDPASPYEPSANDRVHPLGQAYGSRPGEKRIYTDPEGNAVNPTTPQGMGAVGPKAPVPTALGKLPTYDDGGTVQTEEAPGQAQLDDEKLKVAAHQQAIAEHEQALGEVPLGHGQPQAREAAQDIAMHRYPAPQKPARLQYDTEKPIDESKGVADSKFVDMNTENAPLSKPVMNNQNGQQAFDEPMISEASAKTPLGPKVAPQGTGMKQLPGGPISDDVKQAVGQSDMGPDVSKTPPTPQEIINMDRMDAMKSDDLVKLGMAHINERALQSGGVLPMPTPTAPTAQENLINQRKELKDKMINGATEQIRFQAEKDLAELNRRSPLGSEGNHPGFVGKLGHVLGRVGQAALAGTAPYLLPAIPGSQAQLAQQEARGEQGVEQAQAKEMQTAKIAEEKKLPEVAKQRADIAQQAADVKQQEADTKQERVESQEVLDTAKANAQNSIAELKRAQADPNSPQSQAILAKAKNDARRVDLAAGKLGLDADRYKADYLGVDHDGNPLAGAQVTPEGKPVGPKMVPKGDEAGKVFDKYSGTIDKTAAPFIAAYQRSGLLAKNLDLKSKQADALVAPELLSIAAGGAGSGLRMNEAEISRVIGGRSVFDALVARANQIKESGGTFDEAQRAQLKEIAGYINARNGAEVMLFNMGREALLANKGDAGKVREIYEHMQEVSSDLAGKGLVAPGQKAEIGEYVVHNGQVLKITSVKDGKTLGEVVKF